MDPSSSNLCCSKGELYLYFHDNIVLCISSVRICSLCNRAQLETLVILPRLEWSVIFERDCIRSDVTRPVNQDWLYGVNRVTWKGQPDALLTGFPASFPGPQGRSLPGRGRNPRIFWGPQEERNSPEFICTAGQV